MGFEVEVKFRVEAGAVEPLLEHLRGAGATDRGDSEYTDIYLRHPARDFAATNEAFRIRSVGDQNFLTYKGPRRQGPAKTREEIEFGLASGEGARGDARTLMDRLGFAVVATVRKRRHLFEMASAGHQLLIAIDRTDGLGTFAEIEALVESEAGLPDAQEAVLDLGRRLGLRDIEPRSYLRMYLEAASSPAPASQGR